MPLKPGFYIVIFSMLSLFAAEGYAQTVDSLHSCEIHNDRLFHGIRQRPEFFSLSYRVLQKARQMPQEWQIPGADIDQNYFISGKVSVPVKWKGRLKVIAQLRYKSEMFNVGEVEGLSKDFLQFHNTSITAVYQYQLKNNWFMAGHYTFGFKTNDFVDLSSVMDYGGSILVGRSCALQEWGLGIMINNTFGRLNVAPIILFNKELNNRWLIDARLPKEINFKYAFSPDSFYGYGSARAIGANYAIGRRDELPSNLSFRRRSIDVFGGVEKEIEDWLWVGVEAGYNVPVQSVLVERDAPTRDYTHSFRMQAAPFFRVRVFAVVPKSLLI
jgi:hypothetical protein